MADSKEAGKLLPEEPYEWHSTGLSADGAINLESPRKWRLVREQTGHGALYGLRIVVFGDCTIPSLVSNIFLTSVSIFLFLWQSEFVSEFSKPDGILQKELIQLKH